MRLNAFVTIEDGFQLAEQDLKLRGPGDLLGTQQIGLPPFRIADLVRDADILQIARSMAQDLIGRDPKLELPEHAKLRRQVETKHGAVVNLGDVG